MLACFINVLIAFLPSFLLAQSIACAELNNPRATVFYLSALKSDDSTLGDALWQQPATPASGQISFFDPETRKKIVVISHAPGTSRLAHTWLVPHLVEKDMIVICLEHRWMNIYELDFRELYANILARPVEINLVMSQLWEDSHWEPFLSKDATLVTFDDSSLAALLLAQAHLEPLKVKEHQQRYAIWNLWGPTISKQMAGTQWTGQTSLELQEKAFNRYILINPKGRNCAYAQSLNKIKDPFLIISRNRHDMSFFHDEIEYLSTHLKKSKLVELPNNNDEKIFYNLCTNTDHPLLKPNCLPSDSNKVGIQSEMGLQIAQFIDN